MPKVRVLPSGSRVTTYRETIWDGEDQRRVYEAWLRRASRKEATPSIQPKRRRPPRFKREDKLARAEMAARRVDELLADLGQTREIFARNEYGNLYRKVVADARLAVWLVMRNEGWTYPEIAEGCGLGGHSTVVTAVRRAGTGDAA